jgi:hypothetical protein
MILQNKKRYYDSLQDFMEAYFELVEDTFSKTEQARVVNNRIKRTQSVFNAMEVVEDEEEYHSDYYQQEPEDEEIEDLDAIEDSGYHGRRGEHSTSKEFSSSQRFNSNRDDQRRQDTNRESQRGYRNQRVPQPDRRFDQRSNLKKDQYSHPDNRRAYS